MLKTKELEFNYENQMVFKFQNIDLKSNEKCILYTSPSQRDS